MTRIRGIFGRLLGPLLRLRVLSLRSPRGRLQRYALAAIAGIVTFAVLAVLMLELSPAVYTSRWTLILPGAGGDASLFLQGIGQASSNSASPYSSISRSPRVNYREIVMSDTLLTLAADLAELPAAKLGRPRVKLVQQSSLMSFSITGGSPELAQRKAEAIDAALRQTLDELRGNELALRAAGMRSAMDGYSERMRRARDALLEHQTNTQLISTEQLDELIISVESVQRELVDVASSVEQKASYLDALAESLNVPGYVAAAAVVLHADETIRQLTRSYVEARTLLESKRGSFGPNHPRMLAASATIRTVEEDFKRRSFELLGRRDIDVARLVLLDVEDATGALFRDLVTTAAELDGMRARKATLEEELSRLRAELNERLESVARLADLERDHKIAEAVFSSALARIDTGKSDLFVSYPLIQTIVAPTLPGAPDNRPRLFTLAGAAGASLCYLLGLLLLWFRTPPCEAARND